MKTSCPLKCVFANENVCFPKQNMYFDNENKMYDF